MGSVASLLTRTKSWILTHSHSSRTKNRMEEWKLGYFIEGAAFRAACWHCGNRTWGEGLNKGTSTVLCVKTGNQEMAQILCLMNSYSKVKHGISEPQISCRKNPWSCWPAETRIHESVLTTCNTRLSSVRASEGLSDSNRLLVLWPEKTYEIAGIRYLETDCPPAGIRAPRTDHVVCGGG